MVVAPAWAICAVAVDAWPTHELPAASNWLALVKVLPLTTTFRAFVMTTACVQVFLGSGLVKSSVLPWTKAPLTLLKLMIPWPFRPAVTSLVLPMMR